MRVIFTVIAIACMATPAKADFQRWSAEVEENPFSGGTNVVLNYSLALRTQVQVNCDSSGDGIELIAIPGYEYTSDMALFFPTVKLAVDGEIIINGVVSDVGAFGANQAGVKAQLNKEQAEKLTSAFVSAKRQIAVEDGMSSKPFLLTARGSTAAAQKLRLCYEAQSVKDITSSEISENDAEKSQSRTEEDIQKEINALELELQTLRDELENISG